jgi:hypothetical protein
MAVIVMLIGAGLLLFHDGSLGASESDLLAYALIAIGIGVYAREDTGQDEQEEADNPSN